MGFPLRPLFIRFAALGILVLGFVFFTQYVQGAQPCELCLLQRWPWAIVVALGLLGAVRPMAPLLWLIALTLFAGAGIALYHVGVEQHWWAGPSACTADMGAPDSIEALRARLKAAPSVRCDDVGWKLFGLSMATYNFILSLAACAVVAGAARFSRARHA